MLSRKYYEMIAQTIKKNSVEVVDETTQDGNSKWYIDKESLICDLLMFFEVDSKLFDWEKFVDACND